MDLGDDELDEAMVSQSVPKNTNSKKRSRPANGNGNGDDEGDGGEDEGDGVEMGRNAPRSSVASRKSVNGNGNVDPEADTDDEMPSEAGGPSFRFDGDGVEHDGDMGGLGGHDQQDQGNQEDQEDQEQDDEEDDDDAELEEVAIAAEEGSEDEAPNEPERHPRVGAKPRKKRVDPPPAQVMAKKKRTRLSRLANSRSFQRGR